MALHPLAGKPAPANLLIDVARLERDYYERRPNVEDPTQLVSFGTSGHRGTPFDATFTEAHILAIRRPSAPIAKARASTARCSWARTRTPPRPRRIAPPWKCWRPMAWK